MFARHSSGFRCGRTIGRLRGNLCVPATSASSIFLATTFQACPALPASTPLMRNISEGNMRSAAVLPFSKGAPDHAATSPSPEQSMNTCPLMACLPDLDSTNTASTRLAAVMLTPVTIAW